MGGGRAKEGSGEKEKNLFGISGGLFFNSENLIVKKVFLCKSSKHIRNILETLQETDIMLALYKLFPVLYFSLKLTFEQKIPNL